MVNIRRAGHVVLGVRDPQRSIDFYTQTLGMELVSFLEEMQMAFFSFGVRDHDLAVIKVPDDQPVGSSGLAHSAFEIEGGRRELEQIYAELAERGIEVEMTMDHIVTQSLYFLDPDGNRLEFYAQMMQEPEAKQYMLGAKEAPDLARPLDLADNATV